MSTRVFRPLYGRDFSLDLLPRLACLNYPIAIRPIVERLPTSLQRKWEKKVVTYAIDNDNDYPDFRAFATTIERQAKTKNHPNILAKEVIRRTSRPVKRLEEGRILKGDVEVGDKKHCRFHTCDGHDLKDCKNFARKPLQDRLEWLKKSGLCFGVFCLTTSPRIARPKSDALNVIVIDT